MSSLLKIKSSLNKLKQKNDMTEEFDVDGVSFGVSVLTRQEEIDAQAWADEGTDGLSHILKMDVARLSYAIKSIDSLSMSDFIEDPETGDRLQRSLFLRNVLLGLPSPLVDLLVYKYNTIRSALREKLGLQQISIESLFQQASAIKTAAADLAAEETTSQEFKEILASVSDDEPA